MISEILNSFELNADQLRRLIADLKQEEIFKQPAGCANHPAWTIGHLTCMLYGLAGEPNLADQLDISWKRTFASGISPIADAAAYPPWETLLAAFEDACRRVRTRLRQLSEAELKERIPDEKRRQALPTIGHTLVHILVGHFAIYIGQLIVWRSGMGLPRIPESLEHS